MIRGWNIVVIELKWCVERERGTRREEMGWN
jgi:hypothetical protein